MKTEHRKTEFSINKEQGLYVIPCGSGYTCLGFDVCERWTRGYAEWAGIPYTECVRGTLTAYKEYERVVAAAERHATKTGTRCPIHLTPALVGLEGKRVEVTAPDGTRERFWVGKSTGWAPCHLEIKTLASHGGGSVFIPEGASVRVVEAR